MCMFMGVWVGPGEWMERTVSIHRHVRLSCQKLIINWASSRENLSSGFPTKRDSDRSPQIQRLARKLKFRL